MQKIISNPDEFDFNFIHQCLITTHWARERNFETTEISFRNSVSRMLYIDNKPVGFARVLTDYAVFAYLADVYVLEDYRRLGYATIILDDLFSAPELSSIRKWVLVTSDKHKLYAKYGFLPLKNPERYMEYFPRGK